MLITKIVTILKMYQLYQENVEFENFIRKFKNHWFSNIDLLCKLYSKFAIENYINVKIIFQLYILYRCVI